MGCHLESVRGPLVTKLFRLSVHFVRCIPLLLVPQIFPLNICFCSPSALFICQKTCSFLFLMILSRDLLYPAISITSSFDFSSVHHILIIFLTYHISAASSLLSRSFVNVQHSHPYSRMDSVDFGVNFDISVGEDGLHLGECVFRQSYSLLLLFLCGIWHLKLL